MKPKRPIIPFILLTCIFAIILLGGYHYYAQPQLRESYQLANIDDDPICIAYIGDSWAFMHKDRECLIPKLLSDTLHSPVRVSSYGICGLTSKEIYDNFYKNSGFIFFLNKRKYHYCFISAGINDTYKKMSTTYYQKSMEGIIAFLLANHIHPIILEIPDYDIQKSYDRQRLSRKFLRRISMLITGCPIDCKQMFRDALDELISEKGYQDKVSVIRYKSWNNDYSNDQNQLYLNDGLHLNKQGYAKLDSVIAKEILKLYQQQTVY